MSTTLPGAGAGSAISEVHKGKPRQRGWRLLWIFGGLLVTSLAIAGLLARHLTAQFFPGIKAAPDIEVHLPSDYLFTILHFPITNTLLSCWLATLLLAGFFLAARWRARLVPKGLQNLSEAALEALLDLVVALAGKQKASLLFPLAATIFLFIVANALIALLPIFGPIEAIAGDGSHVPLLRGAGTDINMSLALALVAGIMVEASGLLVLRSKYFLRFFPVHHLRRRHLGLGIVHLFIGVLAIITHLSRLLSFTFRLFGNLTAGEILLLTASFLSPLVLGVPFYGLELLVGLVQAGIFAGLTVLFATMAMTAEETDPAEEQIAPRSRADRPASS